MARRIYTTNKHKITHDFILSLYKETKKMSPTEKVETVDKIKDLVKYIGEEIVVDLSDTDV